MQRASDLLLVADQDGLDTMKLCKKLGPRLYELAHDTQIDETEANELIGLLKQLIHGLKDSAGNPVRSRQDIMFYNYIFHDCMDIFDQTLDDDDLEGDKDTALKRALVMCFDLVKAMAAGNETVQEELFDQMPTLLQNKNTQVPAVAVSLVGALREVFLSHHYCLEIREHHVEALFELITDVESKGLVPPAPAIDLLRTVVQAPGHAPVARYVGVDFDDVCVDCDVM